MLRSFWIAVGAICFTLLLSPLGSAEKNIKTGTYYVGNTIITFSPPAGWKRLKVAPGPANEAGALIAFAPDSPEDAILVILVDSNVGEEELLIRLKENNAEETQFLGEKAYCAQHRDIDGISSKNIRFFRQNRLFEISFSARDADFDGLLAAIDASLNTLKEGN